MILYIYMLIARTHTKENGGRNKVNKKTKKNAPTFPPLFKSEKRSDFEKWLSLCCAPIWRQVFFGRGKGGKIFTQMHDGNRPRAGFPLRDAMPPPPQPDTCSL